VTQLLGQNIRKAKPTLKDEVRLAYLALYENAAFRRLRDALEPEETVEGSMQDDDTCAAQMLRKKGVELNLHVLAKSKLHDINLKMRVFERGVNASRKQRSQVEAEDAA